MAPMDDTWHEIEDLVEDIARLTTSDLSTREFYTALLNRAVSALAAPGGAVWLRGLKAPLALEYQINLADAGLADDRTAQRQHQQLLLEVLRSNEPSLVPPRSGHDDEAANPTDFLLVLAPLALDGETVGVIEVLQRPISDPGAQRGYLRFLADLAEMAADFQRNRQLRDLRQREGLWGRFEEFASALHGSLDPSRVAYTIANEGRRVAACDRISVAMVRGRKCRMLAVSGLETFDRRSNAIRRQEQLAKAVVRADEPLWYAGDASALPPEIEKLLEAHLDQSHARTVAVLPLKESPPRSAKRKARVIGVVIAERFDAERADEAWRDGVEVLCRHGGVALNNARKYHALPLLPLWKAISAVAWFLRFPQLPKTVLALAAISGVIAALVFVEADFELEGRGELVPARRHDLFARSDGIVDEVRVEHGKQVEAGDVLILLQKPQLDFESSRVTGELQTARTRLATVQSARLAAKTARAEEREQFGRLTAEEEELKELVAGLAKQEEVLRAQRSDLEVKSPIKGQVLTWNVADLLQARPVQRGQILLTVADLDGPWVLEMRMPDEHVGYVLDAQEKLKQPNLPVSFILATDPGVTHEGRIEKMALSTEPDETDGPGVSITVAIEREAIGRLRPGADVVAKVHCGRRSIGFVWLHDLIEAVQSRIFF